MAGGSDPVLQRGESGGRATCCMWSFRTVSHMDFYVAAWFVFQNSSEEEERAGGGGGCVVWGGFVASRVLNLDLHSAG